MINKDLIDVVEKQISGEISTLTPVSGGSVNQAFCLETSQGKYFIKTNSKSKFPGMFEAEAAGLNLIAKSGTIKTPNIILCGEMGDESFLLMEWIEAKRPTGKASQSLGTQLALMHKSTAGQFGLGEDNYMGSLHQSNTKHDTWSEFFVEERLRPMVAMVAQNDLFSRRDVDAFEKLYLKLAGLFAEEPPSLIHGDLWAGNYLINENEQPYLIDPAVCYGHREFDLAMTTLFGGFSDGFYEAYEETFPLQNGWRSRVYLWNLYPLLVHLNLFGAGYLGQVRDCLAGYL
jgi:protein-ribulosamine 3-kinase